jgi:hypothetical protein
MVIDLLDDEECYSIDDAVRRLTAEHIESYDAEVAVRVAFAVAKHVASIHAAYMQLSGAPMNTRRGETLHKLGDQFARYLIGLPEADISSCDSPERIQTSLISIRLHHQILGEDQYTY